MVSVEDEGFFRQGNILGNIIFETSSSHEGYEHKLFFFIEEGVPRFEYVDVPRKAFDLNGPVFFLFFDKIDIFFFD